MSALPLRMMLVAALVIWSPAWCCCAIRAAADVASAQKSCCLEQPRGCCTRSAGPSCCDRSGSAGGDEEESPCRCHDRPDETQRLDTGSRVVLPALALSAAPPAVDSFREPDAPAALRAMHGGERPRAGPGRSTLLRLHCMLLL